MPATPPAFPTTRLARLTGHNGPVHAVAFSSGSGQYLLTGGQDRAIRLFNPSTSKLVQTYSAHGYEVLDLGVSADNAQLVSVGGDKAVFLWDVATAQTLRRFTGHAGRVNTVAFAGDGDSVVVSGSFDGSVKLWDARDRASDRRPLATWTEARDGISSVAVRGHDVTVGCVDGRVRSYDLAAGVMDEDVVGPSVTSVTPARVDGESYLVGALDSALRLMDRRSGRCLRTFRDGNFVNETYRLRSTLALADACAVSGAEDGSVFVWDVVTGRLIERVWHDEGAADAGRDDGQRKKRAVSAVAWNQLRKQWASAGGDGSVVVWGEGK